MQANAYCTPAGAQGFAVHHDTHDVLVLQVSGRKRWRIYAPVAELPLKDQRWSADDAAAVGAPLHDITLRAGDTLFVPRGWPHEAISDDAASLHVTVGLHPPTRLDALRAALGECADDVEFRRTLDAGGELPAELARAPRGAPAPGRRRAPRAAALRRHAPAGPRRPARSGARAGPAQRRRRCSSAARR